jgi:DNA-binding beta-propeller fold protein YncE
MVRLKDFLVAFAVLVGSCFCATVSADDGSFSISQVFHIGGAGSWDYLTADSSRLYVPRSTHTMVLDAATGAALADIPGQQRNHGVAVVPDVGRGFISDGTGASVTVFDLKTFAVLGTIKAQPDADGIIYDPSTKKVLLVCGDSGVLIPISPDLDLTSGAADPAIDLGGSPEFLAADGQGKAFVNLADKDQVAVVDIKSASVVARYPVAPGGHPVGMSMDTAHRRLFIGCRQPQKLIVMNADNGHVVADFAIGVGVDATKFDPPTGHDFASCRDGTLTIIHEDSPDQFTLTQTLKTLPGARTSGLDLQTHKLYLPTAEMQPAAPGQRAAAKPNTFMILVVQQPAAAP